MNETPTRCPVVKSFTEQELADYCREWAKKNLKPWYEEDDYFARFGLLVDFTTDLFRTK
jgi:isoleucyl-tRNA synthetase